MTLLPTIVAARGCFLHTADGRRLLDGSAGALVVNVGHSRGEVTAALGTELQKVGYVLPPVETEARQRLHDELTIHWLPTGFVPICFPTGGAEAIEAAIRFVRLAQIAAGRASRWKVLGRSPSYHGTTGFALGAGDHRARRASYEPLLGPHRHLPFDDPARIASVFEAADADAVAAVIVEPIAGASDPARSAPASYWRRLDAETRRRNGFVIVDEVMTGLGRCGHRWAYESLPISPDVIVAGKGLAGGYAPLAGVFARQELVDAVHDAGLALMYHTFDNHSSSCAAATAVLQILRREDLIGRASSTGQMLLADLQSRFATEDAVIAVRGEGLMVGIRLDPRWPGGAMAATLEALRHDLLVYPAGSADDDPGLLVGPPLTISDHEIESLADRLHRTLSTGP